MNDLRNTLWIELRKVMRSKIPVMTLVGFLMLPLATGLLMFIYKDPEVARNMGILSTKANLIGGSADWSSYLNIFAQGIAVAGLMLFSLIASWVFGREFSDGTVKDLLAVPVSREKILAAKFIVIALWCITLVLIATALGLLLGARIGLALGSAQVIAGGTLTVLITALLVLVTVTPVAFFASWGRGYLLPMGLMLLILGIGNLTAVLGWGGYFPWVVPELFAAANGTTAPVEAVSYALVLLTGLAGLACTQLWWKYADQSK